jgi:hypothetical protein
MRDLARDLLTTETAVVGHSESSNTALQLAAEAAERSEVQRCDELPLPLSRVSPTIGLGRIGWGCGLGAGLSAMNNILGLVDQGDDPCDHFGHEQDGADPERTGEPAKLPTV